MLRIIASLALLALRAASATYITDAVYVGESCSDDPTMSFTVKDGECAAAPESYQRAWGLTGFGWTGFKTVGGMLVYAWSSESLNECQGQLDAQEAGEDVFDDAIVAGDYMTVAEAKDGACRGEGYTFEDGEQYCKLSGCRVVVAISDTGVHGEFSDTSKDGACMGFEPAPIATPAP